MPDSYWMLRTRSALRIHGPSPFGLQRPVVAVAGFDVDDASGAAEEHTAVVLDPGLVVAGRLALTTSQKKNGWASGVRTRLRLSRHGFGHRDTVSAVCMSKQNVGPCQAKLISVSTNWLEQAWIRRVGAPRGKYRRCSVAQSSRK